MEKRIKSVHAVRGEDGKLVRNLVFISSHCSVGRALSEMNALPKKSLKRTITVIGSTPTVREVLQELGFKGLLVADARTLQMLATIEVFAPQLTEVASLSLDHAMKRIGRIQHGVDGAARVKALYDRYLTLFDVVMCGALEHDTYDEIYYLHTAFDVYLRDNETCRRTSILQLVSRESEQLYRSKRNELAAGKTKVFCRAHSALDFQRSAEAILIREKERGNTNVDFRSLSVVNRKLHIVELEGLKAIV